MQAAYTHGARKYYTIRKRNIWYGVWCAQPARELLYLSPCSFLSLALFYTHTPKHVVCIIKFNSFDVRVKKMGERESEREFSATQRPMCESEEVNIIEQKRDRERARAD